MWKVLRTEVVWRVNSPFERKLSAQDQERRHEDYAPVWVVGRIDLGRRTLASGPHLVGPNLVMRRTWLDSCRIDIGDGGQRNGGDEEDPRDARSQSHDTSTFRRDYEEGLAAAGLQEGAASGGWS